MDSKSYVFIADEHEKCTTLHTVLYCEDRYEGGLKNMKLTVEKIIPDMLLAQDSESSLNLYGARYLLGMFLRIFSRTGEVNQDCLYEILQMDLDQAGEFLKEDSGTKHDSALLNTVPCDNVGPTLATLQMMIHAYLSEHASELVNSGV